MLAFHIYLLSFVPLQVPHADIFKGAEKTQSEDASCAQSQKNINGNDSSGTEHCRTSIYSADNWIQQLLDQISSNF